MELKKIKILSAFFVALVMLMTIATATSETTNETVGNTTHWTVNIIERIGLITDKNKQNINLPTNDTNNETNNQTTEEDEEEEEDNANTFKRKVGLHINIGEKINVNFTGDVNSTLESDENDEEEKEPINWRWLKITLWILIPLIFVGGLIFYFYQIYFY